MSRYILSALLMLFAGCPQAVAQSGVSPIGSGATDAAELGYTPGVGGDWDPVPEQAAAALDQLAARSSGTGDVVGPAAATADAVCRFDGETGKLIQDSINGPYVADEGVISLDADARADTMRQWAMSPYVVGLAGSVHGWTAPYTSIQAAVDAAAAVATNDQPAEVLVLPGSYGGDIAMAKNVFIKGASSMGRRGTYISGQVTANYGTVGGMRTQHRAGLENVIVTAPVGDVAISFEGSHPQELHLENVKTYSANVGGGGISIANGGTDAFSLTSTVFCRRVCSFQTTNTATPVTHSAGNWTWDGAGALADTVHTQNAIVWSGSASVYSRPVGPLTVTGLISHTSTGSLSIPQLTQVTVGGAAITNNGAGAMLLGQYGLVSLVESATTPVQGAGIIAISRGGFGSLNYTGDQFALTLNAGAGVSYVADLFGGLAVANTAADVPYIPVEVTDWSPAPDDVSTALDQLAARPDAPASASALTYTPLAEGDWDPVPEQVASALDQLAARESGGSAGRLVLPGDPFIDWQAGVDSASHGCTLPVVAGLSAPVAVLAGKLGFVFHTSTYTGKCGTAGYAPAGTRHASFSTGAVFRLSSLASNRGVAGAISGGTSASAWGSISVLTTGAVRIYFGDMTAYRICHTSTAGLIAVNTPYAVLATYTTGGNCDNVTLAINGLDYPGTWTSDGTATTAGGTCGTCGEFALGEWLGTLLGELWMVTAYGAALDAGQRASWFAAVLPAFGIEWDE